MNFYDLDLQRERFQSDEIIKLETKRGNKCIFYKKYKYNLKSTLHGRSYYRCAEKRCGVGIYINIDVIISPVAHHGHPSEMIGTFLKYFVYENMFNVALNSVLKPRKILFDQTLNLDSLERASLAKPQSIRKLINQIRKKNK